MERPVLNRYVLGFAFDGTGSEVVLIRKKKVRPGLEFMRDKLNGIGGKVQEGESDVEAMSREFHEEAGINFPSGLWEFCGVFYKSEVYEVSVFRIFHNAITRARTSDPLEGTIHIVKADELEGFKAPHVPIACNIDNIGPLNPGAVRYVESTNNIPRPRLPLEVSKAVCWLIPLVLYSDLRTFKVAEI